MLCMHPLEFLLYLWVPVFLYNHDGAHLELNELSLGPKIPPAFTKAHLYSINYQLKALSH